MKKETIAQETRRGYAYLKQKVKDGDNKVMLHFSGSMRKRTMMFQELFRYESDSKIDFELGIISEEEYLMEKEALSLLEQSLISFGLKGKNMVDIKELREKYMNKEFVIITNTERTVLVTDIDEFYMTVKVTKNRYSRQNCVGNYFPYVNDIVKYPLTALPVMYEVSE